MSGEDLVELRVGRVTYYSPHDESCFFAWLHKMRFVEEFHGRGDAIVRSSLDGFAIGRNTGTTASSGRRRVELPARPLGQPARSVS